MVHTNAETIFFIPFTLVSSICFNVILLRQSHLCRKQVLEWSSTGLLWAKSIYIFQVHDRQLGEGGEFPIRRLEEGLDRPYQQVAKQ